MVGASRRKGTFNAWEVKVPKGHTGSTRRVYHVKDVDRGYGIEISRRARNQALEYK